MQLSHRDTSFPNLESEFESQPPRLQPDNPKEKLSSPFLLFWKENNNHSKDFFPACLEDDITPSASNVRLALKFFLFFALYNLIVRKKSIKE